MTTSYAINKDDITRDDATMDDMTTSYAMNNDGITKDDKTRDVLTRPRSYVRRNSRPLAIVLAAIGSMMAPSLRAVAEGQESGVEVSSATLGTLEDNLKGSDGIQAGVDVLKAQGYEILFHASRNAVDGTPEKNNWYALETVALFPKQFNSSQLLMDYQNSSKHAIDGNTSRDLWNKGSTNVSFNGYALSRTEEFLKVRNPEGDAILVQYLDENMQDGRYGKPAGTLSMMSADGIKVNDYRFQEMLHHLRRGVGTVMWANGISDIVNGGTSTSIIRLPSGFAGNADAGAGDGNNGGGSGNNDGR